MPGISPANPYSQVPPSAHGNRLSARATRPPLSEEPQPPTKMKGKAEESAKAQETGDQPARPAEPNRPNQEEFSAAEKLEIDQLKQADTAIRAHEQAHVIAAGAFAKSGATYEYKKGPDGKNYAVHGEVAIDTSREIKPEDTISKMRVVRAAATAPVDPSPADLKIAANAAAKIIEAKQALRLDKLREAEAAYRKARISLEKAQESQEETSRKLFEDQKKAGKTEESKPATKVSEQDRPPAHYAVNTAAKRMVTLAQYQYFGLDIMV